MKNNNLLIEKLAILFTLGLVLVIATGVIAYKNSICIVLFILSILLLSFYTKYMIKVIDKNFIKHRDYKNKRALS